MTERTRRPGGRDSLMGWLYSAARGALGLLCVILLQQKFADPEILPHVVTIALGVGSFACIKCARQSFAKAELERDREG